MDLMNCNLRDKIKTTKEKGTKLLDSIVIEIALGIAKGMKYSHSIGILHRDLKSLNILVI
jgi:serine/threonine protein kinase